MEQIHKVNINYALSSTLAYVIAAISPLGNKIYFHANCFSPPTWLL